MLYLCCCCKDFSQSTRTARKVTQWPMQCSSQVSTAWSCSANPRCTSSIAPSIPHSTRSHTYHTQCHPATLRFPVYQCLVG
jgi:hypothetical protein